MPDDSPLLLLLRLGQYVLLFGANILISRALGPSQRAAYALPLTAAGATQIIVSLSLDDVGGRFLARDEATPPEIARWLALAAGVLSVIGVCAYFAISLPLRRPLLSGASTSAVLVAALAIPSALLQGYAAGLLLRLGQVATYGVISALAAGGQLAAVAVLVALHAVTPTTAIAASVGGFVLHALPMSVAVARRSGVKSILTARTGTLTSPGLRSAAALHPGKLALFLNLRIDLFIVSLLLSRRSTGLYSLSTSLGEFVLLAAFTVSQSAMHELTYAAEDRAVQRARAAALRSLRWAGSFVMVTVVAGYPLLRFVYGSQWTPAFVPLVILAVAAFVLSAEAPMRALLVRVADLRRLIRPPLVALVINIAANFLLIPFLGIDGSALASLLSYSVFTFATFVLFRHVASSRANDP